MKLLYLCIFCCSLFAAEDETRVMGIGFCPVDLLVQVEDSFIVEHIVPGIGGCQREDTFDLMDDVLKKCGKPPKIVPGGSAANTVRALAQLGQSCAFLGHIGHDSWGDRFRVNLNQNGIDPRLKEAPFTSRVLCLISPDGQRTFLTCDPQIEDMPIEADFRGVKWIHLEARHLFSRFVAERTLELARKLGIRISLDLSCCTTVKQFQKELLSLIDNDTEILFCNEDEAAVLLGLGSKEACYELQKRCPVAIVTKGKDGCLIGHRGKVIAVPATPAKVVDTTAAGDHFAAGFLYGYFRSLPLKECARIGHRLAGAVIEVIGSELPPEVWESLRQQLVSP